MARKISLVHFTAFQDNVPDIRCGYRASDAWDKPVKVKSYKRRDGLTEQGGKYFSRWGKHVGIVWSVSAAALTSAEYPLLGADGPPASTPTRTALMFSEPNYTYSDGFTFNCHPGDHRCHWVLRVGPLGTRLRIATVSRMFDRTSYVKPPKKYFTAYGWGILRDRVLINPICYARNDREVAIRSNDIDTLLAALGEVGGFSFVPLEYGPGSMHQWSYPKTPYWLVSGSSLVCPILSSSPYYVSQADYDTYCPPKPGSLGWLAFVQASGLSELVPLEVTR